ncbi:MAG: hypothetical protein HY885_06635 [Deltaproteobacteria bacterium]|nr:hypothetical protein [Deltaproteobacteria bacterium]
MLFFVMDPNRLGHLDVILPLVYELKSRNAKISLHIVYTCRDQYDLLKKNEILFDIAQSLGKVSFVSLPNKINSKFIKAILSKIFFIFLLPSLLPLAFNRRSIYLCSNSVEGFRCKFIHYLNKINGGKTYTYMATISSHRECYRRYFYDDGSPRQEFLERKKRHEINAADGLLIYNKDNIQYLKTIGYYNFKIIGYPLLYDNFRQFLRENYSKYLKNEIHKYGKQDKNIYISIFINKFWGRWAGRDMDWLRETLTSAIKCIKIQNPSALILVRPHPTLSEEKLNEIFAKYNEKDIIITYLHPSIMALASKYVISIAQSTTFMHVMSMGTPYIEYGLMQQRTYEIFPEGSLFAEFGTIVAKNEEELTLALQGLIHREPGINQFNKLLNHQTDLSLFESYRSLPN